MIKGTKKRILTVVAHGDDEVLGCGATMAKHASRGDQVHVLIMADGVSSRYYDVQKDNVTRHDAVRKLIAKRKKETLAAAKILKVNQNNISFLDLADQRLDTYPFLMLVKRVEEIKTKVKPDLIYTHFYGDLNLDHRLTAQAVLTAFRPCPDKTSEEIYLFEVPESTTLAHYGGHEFHPNFFNDVSEFMDIKLSSLTEYGSERRSFPHMRSERFIREVASKWGKTAGVTLAEAFIKVR